jgi:DNA gyrase inhibitor GyrI
MIKAKWQHKPRNWIIGGTKDKPGLAPDRKTTYDFVVTTDKPFTKTKVMVNRLILENGKLANTLKDVQITYLLRTFLPS